MVSMCTHLCFLYKFVLDIYLVNTILLINDTVSLEL